MLFKTEHITCGRVPPPMFAQVVRDLVKAECGRPGRLCTVWVEVWVELVSGRDLGRAEADTNGNPDALLRAASSAST